MPKLPDKVTVSPDPDTKLRGGFYVSAIKDNRAYALLLGPFETHREALDRVRPVTDFTLERKAESHWWFFGTCRVDPAKGTLPSGALNGAVT